MIVHVDRFDKSEIKHSITAVTAINLTTNTILVGLLHGFKNLVRLSNEGFIFFKGF
jgi:hypothetical protein